MRRNVVPPSHEQNGGRGGGVCEVSDESRSKMFVCVCACHETRTPDRIDTCTDAVGTKECGELCGSTIMTISFVGVIVVINRTVRENVKGGCSHVRENSFNKAFPKYV
jgi:hypothetical protein